MQDFAPRAPAVACSDVRAMGPALRLLRLAAPGRLEGSHQLAVAAASVLRRIDAYYQSAHAATPLAVPDNTVFSVCDLAFMRPEFAGDFPPDLRDRLTRRFAAARRANPRWLAISRATADDLAAIGGVPGERIAVGSPAVAAGVAGEPSADERRQWRERFQISGPFALHVGTLQPRKNLVRLLAACDAVRRRGTPVQLVLAGQRGWLDAPILDAVGRMTAFARYVGPVADAALRALLAEARLFAMPALYEGFGIPALEAMAAGVPVAAARAGSLPEVLGDAAVFFDPLDEDAMAAAIDRLWHDDALRADLGRRGRARAPGFTWEAMVDALGRQFAAGGLRIPCGG